MDYRLFDALLDAFFVVDNERKVVYCNESAATFLNSSVRRLTKGAKLDDLLQLEDATIYQFPSAEDAEAEGVRYKETAFTTKSGRTGRIQVAIQPCPTADGKSLWAMIARDVTLEESLVSKYRGELEQKEKFIGELQDAKKELEAYSKNLEAMVEERTAEVKAANRMLSAIMDSLGQGFLAFNDQGICSNVFTKACLEILEAEPGGKSIETVLRLGSSELEHFAMWRQAVFAETLPFDSLIELAPRRFNHSSGRFITLDYYPIRQTTGKIEQLVLVATDKTAEHLAAQALEAEKEHARMTLKIFKGKDQFAQFLRSTENTVMALRHQVKAQSPSDFDANEAFRRLHTLEGEAGAFSAIELRNAARESQSLLEPLRDQGAEVDRVALMSEFSRSIESLDESLRMFLQTHAEVLEALAVDGKSRVEVEEEDLRHLLDELKARGARDGDLAPLYERYLKKPLFQMLEQFNNVVEVVAKKQGKRVEPIEFVGEKIRVYHELYQPLVASLVHAFRNAVDHGIEEPEVRSMCGKAETGRIKVAACRRLVAGRRQIELVIEDDGGGIPAMIVREKLKKFMAESEVQTLSDEEVIQFIFHPGLSTRESVGEFSGRGVGMDAIKTEVLKLGGQVQVKTEEGQGTKVTILVPDLELVSEMRKSA
ncbi:MAG: Hpt domain-containing protein [Bdellovibrionales bacterium]|nr:Hpt domain-containing protein [Bdellovibrionales bacterium]